MRSLFRLLGNAFRRNMGAGLLIFVPVALTVWLVSVAWNWLDRPVRGLFALPKPEETGIAAAVARLLHGTIGSWVEVLDFPGVGLLVLFAGIFLLGFLARTFIGRALVGLGEWIVRHIPLIRGVYGGAKQIMEALIANEGSEFRHVVLFEYPRKGIYAIGFATSAASGEIQARTREETVNVFLPTTPNPTSGYLLIVPRKDLTYMEMSVEDAVKLIISGGIVPPKQVPAAAGAPSPPGTAAPAGADGRAEEAADAGQADAG